MCRAKRREVAATNFPRYYYHLCFPANASRVCEYEDQRPRSGRNLLPSRLSGDKGNEYFATALKLYTSVLAYGDCVGGRIIVPILPDWIWTTMQPSVNPLVTCSGENSVPWADGLLNRWIVAAIMLSVLSYVRHLLHLSFIGAFLDADHSQCPVPGHAL